jgi:hypothetical protein
MAMAVSEIYATIMAIFEDSPKYNQLSSFALFTSFHGLDLSNL